MRDDILKLLGKLYNYYQDKYSLIQKFAYQNNACFSYLKSNNLFALENAINEDDRVITEIDCLDYDITETKTKLCYLCGINLCDFENFFLTDPQSEIEKQLKEIIYNVKILFSKIRSERDNIVIQMQKQLTELKKDIFTLRNIRQVNEAYQILH